MPSRPIRRSLVLLALAILTLGIRPDAAWSESGALARRAAMPAEDPTSARVIVKYRADSTLMHALSVRGGAVRPAHAGTLSLRLGLALADGRTLGDRTQSLRGSGLSSSQLAAQLAAQPDVEWAVPDRRRRATALSDDPFLPDRQTAPFPVAGQWYLRAPDSTIVSAVNAVGAWGVTTGSPAMTVALLDTGVRFDHPDLKDKLHPEGYDFVQDQAPADDNQPGRDNDASDPGDWTTPDQCHDGKAATDSSWHGTQVAGLIGAATNNAAGMASIGRNVMLLPVRVLGHCGGFDSDIIAGLRWAAGVTSEVGFGASVTLVNAHPAKVINMSLGSVGTCEASYRDAFAEVKAAGVTVVVAAGNENGLAVNSPANCPGVIAVAGVRHAGTKVGYSSIGPEVSIAAPAGNCVNEPPLPCLYPLLTTTNAGTTVPVVADNSFSDGTPEHASLGTSFSAPLVAGAVGLVLSVNPALTPDRVRAVLQASARAFPSSGGAAGVAACHAPNGLEQLECYCTSTTCGAGMLDAFAAVSRALDPAASIAASTTTPTAGDAVTLDGSASLAYANRVLTSYQWTITAGASFASFSGATNRAVATLNTSSAGSVTVQLAITDSKGATATSAASITVAPPAPPAAATGSSGGGAVDLAWLIALAGAMAAVRLVRGLGGARGKRSR